MTRRMKALLLMGFLAQPCISHAVSDAGPLSLVQTIALPGVEGRIDHFAVDVAGQRLFVAALGTDTRSR